MARLYVIGDDAALPSETLDQMSSALASWNHHRVSWSAISFDDIAGWRADLIVVVATPSQTKVIDFFQWLRSHPTVSPVIAVVSESATCDLLFACAEGADDFVIFPFAAEEFSQRILRVLKREAQARTDVSNRLISELGLAHLVGSDTRFLDELRKIPRVASTNCEVLITGETGTGKELCARAVHNLSARRNLPFICVDCGALPDQLFESEMFGHERGAFTDAHRTQRGLVALAAGGTIFLDEIDSLSLAAQSKLLRFLQDRTYRPLGAAQIVSSDVRIVAATNRDLERAVEHKAFRSDLFFRINVLRLHMVPVRERRGDIEILAQHLLTRCCGELGIRRKVLSQSSLRALTALDWPGNVREIYNVIRRAVVFSDGNVILPSHLLPEPLAQSDESSLSYRDARAKALAAFERHYVEQILRENAGNITRAARAAGKDRREFGRLVKRHQIIPRDPQ